MKKVSLLSFAFAALMLGACSSENELVDVNGGAEWNAEGTGYINLAIQLPTQSSNRAISLVDGTPAEYEVKDATLILFTGASQDAATINSAYDMELNFTPEGTTNQITTTSKITQKINEISGSDNIYALVVLNNNGLLNVTANNVLEVVSTTNKTMTGENLESLNAAVKEVIGSNTSWHEEGFLMSNAPMANAVGGSNGPVELVGPLVEINRKNISSTQEDAAKNPAATIYVERAEAKVTLKDGTDENSTAGNVTVNGSNNTGAEFEVVGWAIDNYNNTNKLVRTVNGFDTWKNYVATGTTNDYRFIGTTPTASTNGLYRIYWGDDYNYSTSSSTDLTLIKNLPTISYTNADGVTPAYCFENTTDLDRMVEKNLTRVIVKTKFNDGKSFYTLDGDNTVIWSEDDTKQEILNRLLHDVDFAAWVEDAVRTGEKLDALSDLSFEFSIKSGSNDGSYEVKNITLTESGKGKLNNSGTALPGKIVEWANSHIKLTYYENGIAYYPVYIKHFGDDQTPWDEETADPANIYGSTDQDKNYLGRYGVLRNNWYEITVNSIKNLGTPVIEDPSEDPVDKKESYISVTINILSWAKRTQGVDL